MVSALYVVAGVLLILKYAIDVIRLRRQYRVPFGDGGFNDLIIAVRIHGNAVETIPLALLLMLTMEMNGADIWMLHLTGVLFFLGKFIHSWGLQHRVLSCRRYGMMLLLFALCGMAIFNLIYLPWELVLTLH